MSDFSLRLPTELLLCIFVIHADHDPPGAGQVIGQSSLGWIATTHVCRRWRVVALDHPPLWRFITFQLGLAWTREMYARARNTPLSVTWEFLTWPVCRPNFSFPAQFIAAHMSRTQTLMLRVTPEALHIQDFLLKPAPLLEEAYIYSSGVAITRPLQEDLFAGHAPRLRRLVVEGSASYLPWTCPILDKLTFLEVKCHSTLPSLARSPFHGFLGALQRMTALEHLIVCDYQHQSAIWLSITAPRIFLSRMTSLDLSGKLDDLAAIMNVIRLPTAVTLSLEGFADTEYSVDTLLRAVKSAGPGIAAPVRRLELRSLDIKQIQACVWYSDRDNASHPEVLRPADLQLSFKWSGMGARPGVSEATEAILGILSLDGLSDLTISIVGGHVWSTDTWFQLFGTATQLAKLDVYGSPVTSLCVALSKSSVFLPRLRHLHLRSVDLLHVVKEEKAALRVLLPVWLKSRNEAGFTSLTLYGGTKKREWGRTLKAAIPSLHVDFFFSDTIFAMPPRGLIY